MNRYMRIQRIRVPGREEKNHVLGRIVAVFWLEGVDVNSVDFTMKTRPEGGSSQVSQMLEKRFGFEFRGFEEHLVGPRPNGFEVVLARPPIVWSGRLPGEVVLPQIFGGGGAGDAPFFYLPLEEDFGG